MWIADGLLQMTVEGFGPICIVLILVRVGGAAHISGGKRESGAAPDQTARYVPADVGSHCLHMVAR